MLSTLEADPTIASQVAWYERRRKVMTALLNLGAVTSPGQIRETLRACPELATDGVDTQRELLSILNWPPEAARLAKARAALTRVFTPSVTDAELKVAYEAFDKERSAGITQLVEAGYGKARWLAEHLGAPAAEWDPVAAQALHLLGLGGDERGRAGLLFRVGTHVVRRPDATQAQVAWAIQCLRDSRELWHHLGDGDTEAAGRQRSRDGSPCLGLRRCLHQGGRGRVGHARGRCLLRRDVKDRPACDGDDQPRHHPSQGGDD